MAVANDLRDMKIMGQWAFGPDVRVVGAEHIDGAWLVWAIGQG